MTDNVTNDTLTREDLDLLDALTAEELQPVAPPVEMRARILSAAKAAPQFDESVPGDHESRTLRASEGRWSDIAPGARMKRLSKDLARKTVTCLLELDPNAVAPAHDHEGSEETFVVRGSCRIGALGLSAGDFHRVEAGAHHGDVVASSEGCVLLITFTLADVA